jgi:ABC-type nitrate/sulfonate/bicarbonate transport system substrate-binding protein
VPNDAGVAGALDVKTLWYTRCPVPNASSIAIDSGLLDREFRAIGVDVLSLRASDRQSVRESHFDHSQPDSFREGGNIPPMWTQARSGGTRLIATGWVDEYQAIITLPDSGIRTVADLRGRRLGLPKRLNDTIDYWRAMCLRAYLTALALAGIGEDAVEFVDLPIAERYIASGGTGRDASLWSGAYRARRQQADAFGLIRGTVDAIFTAGAPGAQLAAFLGARDVIDLGRHRDPAVRVNNQVPIALTVSAALLERRPDLVDRYLRVLATASEWAAANKAAAVRTIANDVGAPEEWVAAAYGDAVHAALMPRLSEDRLAALAAQKTFLVQRGFIERDFDLDGWVDPAPLARLQRERTTTSRL